MTEILSCLTPEWVLQVSDRRLTRTDGRVADDDATKAVFAVPDAFAYTGLAKLPRTKAMVETLSWAESGWVRTFEWLAEAIAVMRLKCDDAPAGERFIAGQVAEALKRATHSIRDRNLRRVGFMSIGWIPGPGGMADAKPSLWHVGNLENPGQVRSRFERLDGRPFLLHSSLDLPAKLRTRVERDLRKTIPRTGPAAAARILADAIREIAANNKTVGTGLLVNCIPLDALKAHEAGKEFILNASEPTLDGASFYYMPSTGDNFVQHAPALVLPPAMVFIDATSAGNGIFMSIGERGFQDD